LLVSKFFGRINKDGKGKVIFSNMVDSVTKLGTVFLLPQLLNKINANSILLFSKIEYFVNFVVDNLSTVVTENCRLNPLHRDLLENVDQCKPGKLVSECPVQKPCPKPICPTPNCPEPSCPEASCPECPVCPETNCPEIPECPKCPSPNFTIPIAVISGVILVGVLIILLTRKKAKK
jgi:hypothetical protein